MDATILWGFLGFGIELANNWKVVVEQFGQRASRSVLKFGMDIMYAPVRDYAEDVADARDDFLFPLGTRMVMQLGSVAPLGISTRFEMGLNGAGAGWYAMLGVGVSGSAVPIGDEK